jgi:thiosulfate/3-mercaptopyruvate sulfurtransferase
LLPVQTPAEYPHPNLLVEAAALVKPADAAKFRLLDVRGKAKYLDGHVPGAVLAEFGPWSKALTAGKADAAFWKKELAAVGVSPNKPTVIYSDDIRDEARVWWMLKYAGVADVRVLNGGWAAYLAAGGPQDKTLVEAKAEPHDWQPAQTRIATKAEMLGFVKDGKVGIIDTRTKEEHRGEANTAKKNGHVPGAVHLEWVELLDPMTKQFRPAPELAKLMQDRKINLENECATYCQSGGRAAVVAFGLELMGAKKVRNYYRSWTEWGNADDTPVLRPDKK